MLKFQHGPPESFSQETDASMKICKANVRNYNNIPSSALRNLSFRGETLRKKRLIRDSAKDMAHPRVKDQSTL
jgi:hypothetical protein